MLAQPHIVSWGARLMIRQLAAEANQKVLPTTAKTTWKFVKIAAVRALAAIEWVLYQVHHSKSSQMHNEPWLGVLKLLLDVVRGLLADRLPDAQLDMRDVFLHGLDPICHAWQTLPSEASVVVPFLQRLAADKRLLVHLRLVRHQPMCGSRSQQLFCRSGTLWVSRHHCSISFDKRCDMPDCNVSTLNTRLERGSQMHQLISYWLFQLTCQLVCFSALHESRINGCLHHILTPVGCAGSKWVSPQCACKGSCSAGLVPCPQQ